MIFLRACTALRLRFTEGFSKCWRLRSSVRIPDFSTLRLKRRNAFSKLSSSRTWTTGIRSHLFSFPDESAPQKAGGASLTTLAQKPPEVKSRRAAQRGLRGAFLEPGAGGHRSR